MNPQGCGIRDLKNPYRSGALARRNPTNEIERRHCLVPCVLLYTRLIKTGRGFVAIQQGQPKNHKVILLYDFSIPDRQFHGGFLYLKNKRELKMKKLIFLLGVALPIITYTTNIYAVGSVCRQEHCMSSDDAYMDLVRPSSYCNFSNSSCWGEYRVQSCTRCESGYDLVTKTVSIPCAGTASYQTCQQQCTGCTNCISDKSWSAGNTGYEKKVTRTCDCNTCRTSTSYRCAAGYYGSSINGTSGCTRCPSSGGVYGTSASGSTAITSCYLSSGTSFSDDSGSGTYTSDCYYTN